MPEQAQALLLAVPFAGGNEHVYRPWLELLPPWLDFQTVQLPGRGRRFFEPNDLSIEQMAAAIVAGLPTLLANRPWVLFGHSMGARIAFEILHLLPTPLQPAAVVLSGARAPFLPATTRDVAKKDRTAFIQLLREMNGTPAEILQNDELLDLFLPMLQRDFAHVEHYRSAPERPLLHQPNCFVFGGDQDPDINQSHLVAWQQCFAEPIAVQLLTGDHFFIFGHGQALLEPLLQALQPLVSARSQTTA
ncbi:thioesterase II family protein [Rheinheimera riviphila]|uniref:thioesterase II family protein n=1 Tax=Rheinheimera riviphila TaxID=1834037 RepID=UPI0013E2D9EA|nr:alpha/beta fold hydrolase [Rheinheimera riviphila]